MKYIKADSVLPIALVEELQSYVQGGYIYIPSKKDSKKKWGELSGCKYEIEQRNRIIRKDYQQGKSVDELADIYYLSVHSIRKIIYEKWFPRGRSFAASLLLHTINFGQG